MSKASKVGRIDYYITGFDLLEREGSRMSVLQEDTGYAKAIADRKRG